MSHRSTALLEMRIQFNVFAAELSISNWDGRTFLLTSLHSLSRFRCSCSFHSFLELTFCGKNTHCSKWLQLYKCCNTNTQTRTHARIHLQSYCCCWKLIRLSVDCVCVCASSRIQWAQRKFASPMNAKANNWIHFEIDLKFKTLLTWTLARMNLLIWPIRQQSFLNFLLDTGELP